MGDLSSPASTVKCLVWDLDNTLWQGTLLEDAEVTLPDQVREVITELDRRGILQSIASKNNHEEAWERLEKLGVAEYFLLPQISWGPKSAAIRHIADELKFALTAIAFIDDQPTERAEVTHHLPEVRTYAASDVLSLPLRPEFQPAVTEDSRHRREMYQANARRAGLREVFAGTDEDFLRTLDLRMEITRATEADLARVEELTLRTSQMNATGVHYSDATLRGLLADPHHEVLVISMADRFGSHGAVGIVLLGRHPDLWHVKLLATSCRVVSFGAGTVILRWLVDQAARADVHLAADFRRTDRNRMMEVAYRFAGFTDLHCDCLAAIDGADRDGIEILHLVPALQPETTTMQLVAPELGAP